MSHFLQWSMVATIVALGTSCTRQARFEVVPATPQPMLRFPDAVETPFSEILDSFHDMSEGWVDLIPGMELRVEKAYFEDRNEGTVPNYVGTEAVRYAVDAGGALQQVGLELLMASERQGEASVEALIPARQLQLAHHRIFLQLVFRQTGRTEPAMLLSAASIEALEQLSAELLQNPESTCGSATIECTIFPDATLVAPDIAIVVDGERRMVPLTTRLGGILRGVREFELRRIHDGVPTPVEIDPSGSEALELFLLPGDEIRTD